MGVCVSVGKQGYSEGYWGSVGLARLEAGPDAKVEENSVGSQDEGKVKDQGGISPDSSRCF